MARAGKYEFVAMDDDPAPIHAYSKSELAKLYAISLSTLARWFDNCLPALVAAGYTKRQKVLTPNQVAVIFEHFGEP